LDQLNIVPCLKSVWEQIQVKKCVFEVSIENSFLCAQCEQHIIMGNYKEQTGSWNTA
jgi:hypothetical protein